MLHRCTSYRLHIPLFFLRLFRCAADWISFVDVVTVLKLRKYIRILTANNIIPQKYVMFLSIELRREFSRNTHPSSSNIPLPLLFSTSPVASSDVSAAMNRVGRPKIFHFFQCCQSRDCSAFCKITAPNNLADYLIYSLESWELRAQKISSVKRAMRIAGCRHIGASATSPRPRVTQCFSVPLQRQEIGHEETIHRRADRWFPARGGGGLTDQGTLRSA
ncbi:hypothetical protein CG017_02160 [Burkholderia glumae]|nr:hypothetical protein KS03_3159 [Burkholderia glumae LMG 2196 = ATCC 33617]QKM54131.1 hypothetical protein CG017_02160 [Burkholderia glumae]